MISFQLFPGFNSIKVRLRLFSNHAVEKDILGFNSIKVRLRLGQFRTLPFDNIQFQFHKGTIKTRRNM